MTNNDHLIGKDVDVYPQATEHDRQRGISVAVAESEAAYCVRLGVHAIAVALIRLYIRLCTRTIRCCI